MEEDFIQFLLADAPIAALVADRIHWRERPQGGRMPDIILNNLGGPADYTMNGPSGLKQTRVQIDCWSTASKAEALAMKRAVETAMSGTITTLTAVEIQGMFLDAFQDDVEVIGEAGTKYFRERLDFLIWTGEVGST